MLDVADAGPVPVVAGTTGQVGFILVDRSSAGLNLIGNLVGACSCRVELPRGVGSGLRAHTTKGPRKGHDRDERGQHGAAGDAARKVRR